MNYSVNKPTEVKKSKLDSIKRLLPLLADERKSLLLGAIAILINSSLTLTGPILIGRTIDKYVLTKQYQGVLLYSLILLVMYTVASLASYAQIRLMGGVGQRVLFKLRNAIFDKLQELPVAFFNQNKAGDLISRINNDTDKLNQFFSQTLMQFINNVFIMIGAGIFLIAISFRLGSAALAPALLLLIFTQAISPWVKARNALNLKDVGGMSGEIQESLDNFKVIIAFNRRDYFRKRFEEVNQKNYDSAIKAGLANNIFTPVYGLFTNLAQLAVLAYGIYLISAGNFTLGLLVSFLSYVNNFYTPLRQIAALWPNFQVALAGWDRIAVILSMKTDLQKFPVEKQKASNSLLEFKNVHFSYVEGQPVLRNINFKLEAGKTYALVGPTGGGKTTTASLMARLYDPTKGTVFFQGRDIRSYDFNGRAKKIGFILQEPFLFSGTIRDNIVYGNEQYKDCTEAQLAEVLEQADLKKLLERFENGLETKIAVGSDAISLGQRQLIAFIRAVLRSPELLILDEATANIDTVTEQLLEEILQKLPKTTTKVIIAHRLNTIENADEIFFVNAGQVIPAGSIDQALEMLFNGQAKS